MGIGFHSLRLGGALTLGRGFAGGEVEQKANIKLASLPNPG
jgi:hypothetical protein